MASSSNYMVNPSKTLGPGGGSFLPLIKWNKSPVRPLKLPSSTARSKNNLVTQTNWTRPISHASKWSGATIAYIIAAIVIVIGAYLLFANNASTPTTTPPVTQNNASRLRQTR